MDNNQKSYDHEKDNAPKGKRRKWFTRLSSLIDPHPSVQEISERRRAQLLNIITLILIVLFVFAMLFASSIGTFVFLLSIAAAAFILGKTKYHKAGAGIFAVGFISSAYYPLLLGTAGGFESSIYSTVPIALIVASALVGQVEFLLLTIFTTLATFLAPYYSSVPTPNLVRTVGIVFTSGVILSGINAFRASVERARIKELKDVNRDLTEIQRDLENRVAERTRNLELAAQVGRTVSQVRTLDILLKDAAELIRTQFDLYYVQVYLTDPRQTSLTLQAGTGQVGEQLLARHHRLPIDIDSINGRAAVTKRTVVIPDTAASATFKPNPLLPETLSEMAVPLIVADKVVGVLDMQSNQASALTEENLPAFEALAGQLAVAIQNANLLIETEQARAEVEAHARLLVRTGWDEYMDAIHKPEAIGYVFEQDMITPLPQDEPEKEGALVVPVSLTGETLGELVVDLEGEALGGQTSELIQSVAHQMAQHIENLRLLDNAERYRFEAERAARRQTREGWQEYVESKSKDELGYVYDLKEVRPADNAPEESTALTLPLKVREETVGRLSVQGLTAHNQEAVEFASSVAERLAAQVEQLRLFEETKQGQLELDQRARQLAAVAEIATASSKELDIDNLLHTVAHLTQRQFGLYHAHIFVYDENSAELKITACGWQEGDPHEGTDGTAVIPLAQEQSLVARAARSRQAVIVNDVQSDPGWLPNPTLPDTASEMAVPLVAGDQLLGVLDVQSDRINAFSEEDANIQMTLAAQVATAIQNALSFVRAQQQADREKVLNTISQKIQSATSVEAVLQIAARELGHALGAPLTVAQLSVKGK